MGIEEHPSGQGVEGLTDLSEGVLPGLSVLEKRVLPGQGRAWRGRADAEAGWTGAYLGEARGLRELGAHVSLIHANQRSVQFLSSLQVTF